MASLELQFVLGRGLSSRLIAWWGNGYNGYSHVDTVMPDGRLAGARSDRVGGQPAGFHVRKPDYEQWKKQTVVVIPCTEAEKVKWLQLVDKDVGANYDKADILGLILGRPWMTAGNWICSASVFNRLQKIGKVTDRFPFIPQQISPNTLLAICCSIGGATYGDRP